MKQYSRFFCVMLAVAMVVSLLAACSKAPTEEEPVVTTKPAEETVPPTTEAIDTYERDKAEYDAMTAEQLVKKYVADPANITVEEYCNLIATYAFVPTTEDGDFEYENKTKDAIKIVKDAGGKIPSVLDPQVAQIMLAHPYPNARAYYYSTLSSGFADQGSATYNALLAQYSNETELFVIANLISGASKSLGADPDYCAFVLSLADSEEIMIRRRVAVQLDRLTAADRDTLVATGIQMMSDPEKAVRNAAMESCGDFGGDEFVEPLNAILMDVEQSDSHSSASKGMVALWYHYNFSEAAYRATLEYFKTESTDPDSPCWEAINELTIKTGSRYDEWRAEASYFNEAELVEIMRQLVLDAEKAHLIKVSAVKVIGAHGTADDLNELRSVLETMEGMEKYIEEVDKQLAKK